MMGSDPLSHKIVIRQRFERSTKDRREHSINYFFAFEGLTEYLYMKGIKDNIITKDRRARNVELVLLFREKYIKDCSDPIFNMERLRDYVHAVSTDRREISAGMAVGKMIIQLVEMEEPHLLSNSRFQFELYQYAVEALEQSGCMKGRYIDDEEVALVAVRKAFIEKGIDPDYADDVDYPVFESLYNETTDKMFLIVDRDYSESHGEKHDYKDRDREYYRRLVKECRDDPDNNNDLKHIRLIVSNPCFEFWLMLHFDDVLSFTPDEIDGLRENIWNAPGMRLSEKFMGDILRKNCNAEYSKVRMDFKNHYMPRLQDAIENAQSFCVNLDRLEWDIGSNMGKLLTEIMSYPE